MIKYDLHQLNYVVDDWRIKLNMKIDLDQKFQLDVG